MRRVAFSWHAGLVAALAAAFLLGLGQTGRTAEPIPGSRIGALVMHGKGGTPNRTVDSLVAALKAAGVVVEAPLMPWGKDRIYDKSYDDAQAEMDGYVAKLRAAGAQRIVIVGHSIGGNAVIGYGARHQGIAGYVALAPAHNPENPAVQKMVGDDVARAKAMIDAGKGGDKGSFADFNIHPQPPAYVTAAIYYSWFAADGPAAFPANIAKFDRAAYLLWIDGPDEVQEKKRWHVPQVNAVQAMANARYERIEARHLAVPDAAIPLVLGWLRKLP